MRALGKRDLITIIIMINMVILHNILFDCSVTLKE